MEILHRKLLSAGASNANCNYSLHGSNCSAIPCIDPRPPLTPPVPSPPVRHDSSENQVIPYLISLLCALGVAFFILSTCTIILRYLRWRRRNSRRLASSRDEMPVDEDDNLVDYHIWRIVTAGLQQSVIDSIAVVKYKRCDGLIEGTDCSVCLTEFEEGDDLRLLPKCSHAFHRPCIDTWLRSHTNCPLCRAAVVNDASPENFAGLSPNSSEPGSSGAAQVENSENHGGSVRDQAEQGESSRRRDTTDDFDTKLEERAFTHLGENRRVHSEVFQPARRSISLDASVNSAVNNAVVVNDTELTSDGSSKQEKVTEVEDPAKQMQGGSSMSRLIKSSSNGCSLQKLPVSMKRSFSSSAKIFSSFRGSKSQALPI